MFVHMQHTMQATKNKNVMNKIRIIITKKHILELENS